MRRRVLPMLLTAAMIASSFSVPAFAAPFSDTNGHWGQKAIERWSDHNIVNGSDGQFRPDDSLTRAEMATILANLLKLNEMPVGNPFSDLDQNWYTNAILKCYEAGIMSGDGASVRPNDPVTREEAMVMLSNALRIAPQAGDVTGFDDAHKVSNWAEGAVNALLDAGIVNGVGDDMLAPQGLINRASVVTILNNAIGNYVSEDGASIEANGGMVLVVGGDVTITGEADSVLILGGDKEVTMEDLKVEGDVLVEGADTKVVLSGETEVSNVTVAENAAGASVEVGENASAGEVTVEAPAAEVSVAGQADSVTVTGEEAKVEVSGKVDEVAVGEDASGAAVSVTKEAEVGTLTTDAAKTEVTVQGKVEDVNIGDNAAETTVKVESTGSVEKVETKAEDVAVSGKGEVGKVEASGDNTAVTTPGTKVEAAEGTSGVTAGSNKVEGGSEATTNKPSSGGDGGSSSGGGSSHRHSYATEWSIDAEKHWHAATCGHDLKADEAAHSYTDGKCVCGYVENAVAKIGDKYFATLQGAIEAVEDGQTITLLADVTVTKAAYGTNALNHARAVDFTLDLNEKTLSADTGNSVFRFNIAGSDATKDVTVTIKNGTVVSGDNTWCALMASGISADVKAVMNLENLTVKNSKAGDLAIKAWGNSVINADTVKINATKAAGGFYAVGGEIVLDNCTVEQKGLHTAPYLSMAFAVSDDGKMTINSGTYSAEPTAASEGNDQGSSQGSWCGGVMNSGGTLIINGGTFSNGNFGEDSLATAARGLIFGDTASNIELNGGTFNALKTIVDYQNNLGVQPNPNIVINGGIYSADPRVVTSYGGVVVKEGYTAIKNEDGKWIIAKDTAIKTAEALAKAIAAGGEVVLGADIELTEAAVVPEEVTTTLNLNGYAITMVEGKTQTDYAIKNLGTLTLKDPSGTGSVSARGIYNGSENVTNAKITVESGTYNALGTDGGAAIWNFGIVEIKDGTFTGKIVLNNRPGATMVIDNATVTGGNLSYLIQNSGDMTINNVTLNGGFGGVGCYNGTTIINDGDFKPVGFPAYTSHVVYIAAAADVTINGGHFKMNYSDDAKPDSGEAVSSYYGAELTINGGIFYAHFDNISPVQLSSGSTITGGTFLNHSGEPSNHTWVKNYVASGYTLGEDGKVTKDVIDTAKELEDAIAAGGTVEPASEPVVEPEQGDDVNDGEGGQPDTGDQASEGEQSGNDTTSGEGEVTE